MISEFKMQDEGFEPEPLEELEELPEELPEEPEELPQF